MLLRRLGFTGISIFLTVLCTSFSEGVDCKKAEAYFQKAYRLPENLSSLIQKEQLYGKAAELCPSYAQAHNNLGDIYERQGRFEEAIAQYKKAMELKPDAPYPYFGLGDIYYKTNRPKEAIEWYEKGLKYNPNDVHTWERLKFARDISKKGVIQAETIRGMLNVTRAPGEIVPITFGEGLIPFDYNKSDIRPDAKPQLNEIGKALRDFFTRSKDIEMVSKERRKIEIGGHADARGTDAYNLDLSHNRVESVVNYLITEFKIPRERLIAQGYAKRVPLCADSSEACYALNRRVEIARRTEKMVTEGGRTRSVFHDAPSFRGSNEPKLVVDTGFFYQRSGEKLVRILTENSHLHSRADRYFVFVRPLQNCYVYLLQEDSKGNVMLLFPEKETHAYVKAGRDYWMPAFGQARTLNDARREEKIYLLATSWPLKSEIEGLSFKEQVRGAINGLKTRIIKVVKPDASQPIHEEELKNKPQRIKSLIERVEGEEGWVKVVKF